MNPQSAHDYTQEIHLLMDKGQFFSAYDLSVKALQKYPDSTLLILLGALALINSGAKERARHLLEPIQEQLQTSDNKTQHLYELFEQCVQQCSTPNRQTSQSKNLQLFSDFAKTIHQLSVHKTASQDIKTLEIAAEVYYKIWESSQKKEDLELSKSLSLECYERGHSIFDGIRAAILCWISTDKETARQLAEKILQQSSQQDISLIKKNLCQYYLTQALAQLILTQGNEAITSCQQAMLNLQGKHARIVNMRKILTLMVTQALIVPSEILTILQAPVIVLFAGQAIDQAENELPCFPSYLETPLAHILAQKLEEIHAEIAYCSAACGSDLLFIETMLDRGAEVNIILPFAEEDFLNARIRYAGNHWERRFKNALKLANQVIWSTHDPYLNDDELFRYNNLLIEGNARLRAESLQTQPQLMVVMDYLAPAIPGSAADFMDQWADISSLHLIDLETIRDNTPLETDSVIKDRQTLLPNKSNFQQALKPRTIKSMLFADIVHYSKMKEEQLPALFNFLGAIKERLQTHTEKIDLVESWGDALYVALSSTRDMADYAFALCQAMEEIDYQHYGLKIKPELRIGLHVGPVYEGIHPLTDRKIIYGQHVSRAARIEPITVAGEIYASEQFVAVLKAEENVTRHLAQATNSHFEDRYYPEYIGILELPKKFGSHAIYHLRTL